MTSHLHPVQVHHPRPTRYVRPATLDGALRLLNDARPGTARVVAGATDLSLEIERGARRGIELLVDLSATDLGPTLALRDGNVTVSAGATHRDVIRWPEAARVALPLAQACAEVGSPQLRNRATVIGNVVTASPANDTISALSALDAQVHLRSSGSDRTLPLGRFITGFRTTALEHGEIVVAISFPALGNGRRGIFAKLGNRSSQAISVVHLAAVVEADPDSRTMRRLTLAVGSIGPVVRRFDHVTDRVAGGSLDTTIWPAPLLPEWPRSTTCERAPTTDGRPSRSSSPARSRSSPTGPRPRGGIRGRRRSQLVLGRAARPRPTLRTGRSPSG
jgi:CO/xanthine dehydrogenase FAD-binding subunit